MQNLEAAKNLFLQGLDNMAKEAWPDAEAFLRQSLALLPDRPSTLINLSICLIKQEKFEAARAFNSRALDIEPSASDAWTNQGLIENAADNYEEALKHLDQAISLEPDNAIALGNRGIALHELQRYNEAMDCYRKATLADPSHATTWAYWGVTLEVLGKDTEAVECFHKALQIDFEHPLARWSLCKMQLKLHDYAKGWRDFELRMRFIGPPKLVTNKPRWSGRQSSGSLLLWAEQGIGDQILYASILPDLASLPQRKMLALDKRLHPLFARSMPKFELLDLDQPSDSFHFDEHMPLGSLPSIFRRSTESFFASRRPYLIADPVRSQSLRQDLRRADRVICGLSWSSSRAKYGAGKSIALHELLRPLCGLPVDFVNLQYGDTTAEIKEVERSLGITVQSIAEIDNKNDIDGLSALIDACDVVLTTSNTTAHLAGALGKATLVLLPLGPSRFWYWSEHNGRNPWYPSVMQFSQERLNSWDEPLQRIRKYFETHHER